MNSQNKTLAGGGVGGALGYLLTIFGPVWWPWFAQAVQSTSDGAAIATAFGVVFGWIARYIPTPE